MSNAALLFRGCGYSATSRTNYWSRCREGRDGLRGHVESEIISQAATRVGSQSIVVVMDVKKDHVAKKYQVFTHNGTKSTGIDPKFCDFIGFSWRW